MTFRSLFLTSLMLGVCGFPAVAQWVHQEHGSAFNDQKEQLALTAFGQYAVGLRCSSANDLTVVFITPEVVDGKALDQINALTPKVLIRIDQNEAHAYEASGDNPSGSLSFYAAVPEGLAKEVMAAQSGVSVAVQMLGSLYHETRFSARGSTRAVSEIVARCGLLLQ